MLQKLKFNLVLINVISLTVVLFFAFMFVYISLETQFKREEALLLNQVADDEIITVPDFITIYEEEIPKADMSEETEENDDANEASDKSYETESYELPEETKRIDEKSAETGKTEENEEDGDFLNKARPVYSTLSLFYVIKDLNGVIVNISPNIFEKEDHIKYLVSKTDLLVKGENINTVDNIDLGEIKLAFLIKEKPNGKIYVYVDRSSRVETMRSFVFLATISWAISIICVFAVSLYLASKAIKPVKESIERQDKFIADASHELRTPIAVIRTNVELVMDSPEQTVEENIKWLRYIHNEAKRMTKMTEELLILSRSSTKKAMAKEKIDISSLVGETFDSFKQLLTEQELGGESDIVPDIWLLANGDSIKQMITILIDNAIKYTNEGSINLALEKDAENIYIKLIDTGVGIAPENISKVFERFFRADKSRTKNTGGAGLGLSIAWVIAKEHGGEITVTSELGKGSEFCVVLPLNHQG